MEFLLDADIVFCRSDTGKFTTSRQPRSKGNVHSVLWEKNICIYLLSHFLSDGSYPLCQINLRIFYSILFSAIKGILIPGLTSSQKQENLASKVSWILLGKIFMVSNPKRVRNLRKFGKVIITLTGAVPTCTHSPTRNSFNIVEIFICHVSLIVPCFRAGGYFTYLQGPLAAKIQAFRGLDKPSKEPIEAPELSPDTCSVHYHPFLLWLTEAWPAHANPFEVADCFMLGLPCRSLQRCRFCPPY